MAVPWLRLVDAALGLTDVMRRAKSGADNQARQVAARASVLGGIEARLVGAVVAALKEAFDRDHQRLELERQRMEAERQRAERALRLERLRQAGDREIGRMRLTAGFALASWLGTLLLAPRLLGSAGGRAALGAGWFLLLLAVAMAFFEQSRIARAVTTADDRLSVDTLTSSGTAGTLAPWLVVGGLAAAAVGTLIS